MDRRGSIRRAGDRFRSAQVKPRAPLPLQISLAAIVPARYLEASLILKSPAACEPCQAMSAEATLFSERELSSSPWESLLGRAKSQVIDPSAVCRAMYDQWKTLYRSFRDLEKKSLYDAEKGVLPKPNEGILRGHRHCIAVLTQRGEELAHLFDQIASSLSAETKDSVLEMKIPLGVLLESLRETMELWHPANKPKCPDEMKGIFGDNP
jgi:hypothetical protein